MCSCAGVCVYVPSVNVFGDVWLETQIGLEILSNFTN